MGLFLSTIVPAQEIQNALDNGPSREDQLDRAAGMPTKSELDYRTLTEAKLSCRNKGSQSFLGSKKCGNVGSELGLKGEIQKRFKDSMKAYAKNYYKGVIYTDLSAPDGAPRNIEVPVCNLSVGEGEGAANQNYKGDSCLDLARLTVDTSYTSASAKVTANLLNGRVKEFAWWRGLYLQVYFNSAGKVMREFEEQGKVTLTRLPDGSVPTGPIARDALRLQIGRDRVIREIASIKGSDQEELGYARVAETKCEARDDKITSHACRLSMVNEHEVAQWTYLMMAEANIRTQVEVDRQFENMETLLEGFQLRLEPICKNQYDADCTLCRDSTRTRRTNRCYQEQMPNMMKQELARYPTDNLLPIPYEELKREVGDQASSSKKDAGSSSPFQFGDVSNLLALSLLGLRSRKKHREVRNKKTLVLLFLSLTVAAISWGCGGGGDPAGFDPATNCSPDSPTFDPISCNGGGTGLPEGAGNFNGGRDGLAAIRNEYLGSEYNLKEQDKKVPKLAATAQGVDGGFGAGESGGNSNNNGAGGAMSLPKVSFAKSGGGSMNGGTGSDDRLTANENKRSVASDEEESKTLSKSDGFGDAAKGGGGSASGEGSIFGSLFGSKGLGGGAGAGAGESEGAGDLDAYLKLVGNKSLFEIVNRRYDRWSTELEISRNPAQYESGRGAAF